MEDAGPTRVPLPAKRMGAVSGKAARMAAKGMRSSIRCASGWDAVLEEEEAMNRLAMLPSSLRPPSPPPPPRKQPSRAERERDRERKEKSGAIMLEKKKGEEKQPVAETAQFLSRPPLVQREMVIPPEARKKNKKKEAPVAVRPSTTLALDSCRKEERKQEAPSKPAFVNAGLAAYRARRAKEKETEPEEPTDIKAHEAHLYRKYWNDVYAGEECGSYEDTTSIPPMCFTDSAASYAIMRPTLQVFSVKIQDVQGGLIWPLDVYGVVAIRDVVDRNRNIVFYRERDNSQTIHSQEPFLALTGPTRAPVVMVDPTYFEVDLKVKGAVQSEDKDLSLLAICYISNGPCTSCVLTRVATSKLSTLKFTFGHIVNSVEATVSIEILGGKWPEGYRKGVFTASTASIEGMDITLLSFGDGKLPVANGQVKLSRRVICVELVTADEEKLKPKLMVSVKALHVNEKIGKARLDLSFKPKRRGRSHRKIKVDCCEMQVTVAWSLLSSFKCI